MEIKVSVIVPVYNVERYIAKSIESICKQDFCDYEVVLVDDGSNDKSIEIGVEILEKYGTKYVVVRKKNGGLSSARNAGLKVASGKYVCFIDSDDLISTTHINDLWNLCQNSSLNVAFSLFQLTYEQNRNGETIVDNCSKILDRDTLLADFLIRKLRIHCCSLLINRGYLLERNIYFNELLRYGEDIDFMWRLFPTLTRIGCTQKKTYLYLQRTNSLMSMQNKDRVIVLLREFKKTIEDLRSRYPNDEKIWKHLYGKASLAFYRTFAESSDYVLFKQLLIQTNYKKNIVSNITIKSYKIASLAICLLISPRLFVEIVKRNRETVSE